MSTTTRRALDIDAAQDSARRIRYRRQRQESVELAEDFDALLSLTRRLVVDHERLLPDSPDRKTRDLLVELYAVGLSTPEEESPEPETCQKCGGSGFFADCIDDLCHGNEECIHGDDPTCSECHGEGRK